MFLKMVKHELHAAARALLPILGGLLAMAILARGSIWLIETVESPVTRVVGVLMVGLFFLACVAAVVTTMIVMMTRFARSVYGDEGYLTHTLPVNVSTILLSRLLVTFLAVVASIAAVYVGIRITSLGVDSLEEIGLSIRLAFREGGIETKQMLFKVCIIGTLSILNTILMICAAISIGHSFSTGKTGKSVLFFFVLYFAAQIISTIAMVILVTVKFASAGDPMTFFNMAGKEVADTVIWFSAAQSLVFGSIYYFLTWIMTKKGLNLG